MEIHPWHTMNSTKYERIAIRCKNYQLSFYSPTTNNRKNQERFPG